MDGINCPLTKYQIEQVLEGWTVAVSIPDHSDPEGPVKCIVYVRLKKEDE